MATNEFDPDQFDWGTDGPGIDLDDLDPSVVEAAAFAALKAQESTYGWRYLRKSERKEGAGRLYRVKYFMPEDKREFFEREFPGYTFVWDSARSHHDHPVAHLCTELNELDMVEDLVSKGEVWIDLFGNGKRDRKYRRKCINLYTMATAKDYLRNQNPGPNDLEYDIERLCNPDDRLGKINCVTVTHALYYLPIDDIGRIVNTSKGRRMRALIHRHKDTQGELNAGEQVYTVDENGWVKQVNAATGEKYEHPTLEGLFHQTTARTKWGGVTWTLRAGGGDSYILDFVGCPNELCGVYRNIKVLKEKSWEVFSYKNLTVKKFLHWTWMSATTQKGEVMLQDVDLFNKLRRYVAGKSRSVRLKTETMNYARRLCNKADIISIHGGGAHEIPIAAMADYVEVAFYVDVRAELDVALSFHKENHVMLKALNSYYDEGTMPIDFTIATGCAIVSTTALTKASATVLGQVRELERVKQFERQYLY